MKEEALVKEALFNDSHAKAVQKKYKDAKPYVKHHQISTGDQVLLKQQQTKRHSPYDPDPYTVVDVHGHQITANRNEQVVTRDAQKWKAIHLREKPDYAMENEWCGKESTEPQFTDEDEASAEGSAQGDARSSSSSDAEYARAANNRSTSAEELGTTDGDTPQPRRSSRSTRGQKPSRYGINDQQ